MLSQAMFSGFIVRRPTPWERGHPGRLVSSHLRQA